MKTLILLFLAVAVLVLPMAMALSYSCDNTHCWEIPDPIYTENTTCVDIGSGQWSCPAPEVPSRSLWDRISFENSGCEYLPDGRILCRNPGYVPPNTGSNEVPEFSTVTSIIALLGVVGVFIYRRKR